MKAQTHKLLAPDTDHSTCETSFKLPYFHESVCQEAYINFHTQELVMYYITKRFIQKQSAFACDGMCQDSYVSSVGRL